MAKILITTIGTGDIKKDSDSDYIETNYEIEGKNYKNTLTSQVILEHYGIEKVIFIGTSGSMWDNLYFKYNGDDENYLDLLTSKKQNKNLTLNDLKELEKTVDKYLNNQGSKCLLMDYSENDFNEIWGNFEVLLNLKEYFDEKDEIYLDITHGFRYMPILNIFALEFLSTLQKDLNIKSVLYGMFAGNNSKIIDFKIFFELLEWAKAIEEMEKFSSLDRLVKLSSGKIEKNGFNNLNNMAQAFEIANMTAIYKSINNLQNHLNYFSENENKVIKLISPRIESFVKRLSKNTLSDFQFELAKFFAEKHNYALGYIALAEAVVTKVCEKRDLDTNNKDDREKAKDIMYEYKSYPFNSVGRKFWELYFPKINKIRNNIAHQLETNKNPKQDIENFAKYFNDSKKYLKELF